MCVKKLVGSVRPKNAERRLAPGRVLSPRYRRIHPPQPLDRHHWPPPARLLPCRCCRLPLSNSVWQRRPIRKKKGPARRRIDHSWPDPVRHVVTERDEGPWRHRQPLDTEGRAVPWVCLAL